MVNRDTRDHNRQGQSKYAQSNDISRRFSPNTGTAGNSNVGDKKDNIRDNVHDKSILTRPDTFFWEWIIEFWFSKLIAIKMSNTWCKYNDQNKSKSDQQLAKQCCIDLPDKLKCETFEYMYLEV